MAKTKEESKVKKKTTKKSTSKKKTTNSKKKVVKKKSKTIKDLSLWVYNGDSKIEKVIVPLKYKMDYIKEFGVMEITTKTELKTWLENKKLSV